MNEFKVVLKILSNLTESIIVVGTKLRELKCLHRAYKLFKFTEKC